MQLLRARRSNGQIAFGVLQENEVRFLPWSATLADLLAAPEPMALTRQLLSVSTVSERLADLKILPPVDRQEIWAAGVTYKRSKIAREEESVGASVFYDKVYTAARPELFMKATAARVMAHGEAVRIRHDGKWNVPEPELALVVSPALRIVGYTIGNDMSSRDIEGENPLYLPQAKVYRGSCSLGPVVTLAEAMPPLAGVAIDLAIERAGERVFAGSTTLTQMARTPDSLVEWLAREIDFPDGVVLLTGTGIVPPDSFTLARGDKISIKIDGIGTLTNHVD